MRSRGGIEKDARNASRDLSVEEIQDKVENSLMATGKFNVARLYITYRYKHNELRKMSNIDQKISGIVERDNEEVKQENSNKNPTVLSVQRDYMAGNGAATIRAATCSRKMSLRLTATE